MPRFHLFEFHDHDWYPGFLRESTTETLAIALCWAKVFLGPVKALCSVLDRTGGKRILDLCSGSGGPVAILARELEETGRDVVFTLSDLFPHRAAFEALAGASEGRVDFQDQPVDATAIPEALDHPVRTMIDSFHHFRPDRAKRILEAAVRDKKAIFIVEGFPRSLLTFLAFVPYLLAAALVHPFLAKKHGVLKFLFTWLIPVFAVTGLFDGVVSALRIHSPRELDAMVADLDGGYRWEHGSSRYFPWGRATWFVGLPDPSD